MVSPTARKPFSQLQPLSSLIEARLECFASGSQAIRQAALNATKFLFDLSVPSEKSSGPHITELLASLEPSSAPRTRSQSNATGRGMQMLSPPPKSAFETTPLTSLFVDGMTDDQVWAQLDLRAKHICDTLEHVLEGGLEDFGAEEDEDSTSEDGISDERLKKALEAMANGGDVDFDTLRDSDSDGSITDEDAILDESSDEDTEDDEVSDEVMDGAEDLTEGFTDLRDPTSDENEGDLLASHNMRHKPKLKNKSKRRSELNDGFFDLETFNAETERAEARTSSEGRLGVEVDSDDDRDDMSIDLFAPLDDEEGIDEEGGDSGEAMYGDFFGPPARTAWKQPSCETKNSSSMATGQVRFHEEVRVKKIRAKGKNLPLSTISDDDEEEEHRLQQSIRDHEWMSKAHSGTPIISDDNEDSLEDEEDYQDQHYRRRDTIARLKDDLFADEGDSPHRDLSTHEKRMSELCDQIAALESENVGARDWVLMGEAGSRARPQNSLLEEDLEFERAMKAVPIITEETVQVLEERIKARILEGRFDDVVRLRPVDDKPFLPSRLFELKDTKSTRSLAQIYQDEYVASRRADVTGEDRDGKLSKEHEEIERLWEGISYKLDALCNSHFMPKQPKATISTVTNVSAAMLESALPTTKSVTAMLAPEEVFTPLAAEPRARSELTPNEKRTLRSRERKARKRFRDSLERNVDKYAKVRGIGEVKKQKRAALESVVKSGKGVTVVGKSRKEALTKHRGGRV